MAYVLIAVAVVAAFTATVLARRAAAGRRFEQSIMQEADREPVYQADAA